MWFIGVLVECVTTDRRMLGIPLYGFLGLVVVFRGHAGVRNVEGSSAGLPNVEKLIPETSWVRNRSAADLPLLETALTFRNYVNLASFILSSILPQM